MTRINIKLLLIILLLNSNCRTVKSPKPGTQSPNYTKFNYIFLEKVKLNPYPSEIVFNSTPITVCLTSLKSDVIFTM